jgi:hypothetical protein
MATKKTKKVEGEPTVVVGSHLTVTTYPNGRKELVWDDEALMRDVQEALAMVATTPKEKKPRKKKNDA